MTRNHILTFITALLFCGIANAQIKVDAPNMVAIDEQFNITFTLTERAESFDWQPGDNFQVVWGPQTGSSTSMSIINGKVSRSSQYTYTYVLLPRSKGKFTLPAAHAVVSDKDVASRAVTIEVVGDDASAAVSGSQNSSASASSSSSGEPQAQSSQKGGGSDLFMRFSLSRTNVVVGEPITATLKLYTRVNIANFEDAKFPTFNGFWAQETQAPQQISFVRENVGDKIYNAAVLRSWVIIPQKTGSISIDPAELVCLVQQRVSSGNSIFDGFFDDFQTVRKHVTSAAYTVKVSELPSGAPTSFTGAVGSFRISAKMAKDSMKVHDAASVLVTISGKGNVALVGAPKVKFPPDSEVYDTKTTDNLDAGSGGTSGSRVFEFPFIPRSHGEFEIESVEFSYYDISARKYVTLRTNAIPYKVAPGESSSFVSDTGVAIPSSVHKDVKNLSEDIHFITTKLPKFESESSFFVMTPAFWIILAALAFAAVLLYFGISKLRKDRSDVVRTRTKGASKMARKRLTAAAGYMSENLSSAYYEELHKALLGYASYKLNIASSELSGESIASAFTAAGVPSSLVSEYTALLDECAYARYAPQASENAAMKGSYERAVNVISDIDSNMKKTRTGKAVSLFLIFAAGFSVLSGNDAAAAPSNYVDSLWNSAVSAYSSENYAAAVKDFSAIENLGLYSPELYLNIANSHYKNREKAAAVLYYERALKLDPSCKDAKYNLQIVQQTVQDRIETVPEFFVKTFNRKVCYLLASDSWAVLGIVFFSLTLAMLLVFLLSRGSALRKLGFFSSIAALIISVVCIVNASWQKDEFENVDAAVIFSTVCAAKSSPSAASGSDLFVLHEGTKVKVLDTVGEWSRISLSDGREGWVLSSTFQLI